MTPALRRWIAMSVLAVFGVVLLLYLLPVIATGPVGVWSFAGRLAQCVFALAAAFAIFSERSWAQRAIVATGAAVAITALGDAFLVGIIAPLAALLVAVIAIAVAIFLVWLVRPT